jgi:AraC-like DNA-binding protein
VRSEPGISREIVDGVLQGLRDLGFHAEGAGAAPSGIVPGDRADALLENASQQLGLPALSLALANKIPIGGLGLADYATWVGPTLGAGLHRLKRHYGLFTQRVSLALVDKPPHARLRFTRDPALRPGRHWVEFSMAMIASRVRELMGPDGRFDRVTFQHPAPGPIGAYESHFACPVAFEAEEDALHFASALLAQPLRGAAAALGDILEARMRELEVPAQEPDAFLGQVRRALVEALDDGETQLVHLAKRLSTSRRTLQRELERRGTSHKVLLDDLRKQRALHLLEDRTLPVSEIAARLRFTDPSSFFRAFRRWTGASPAEQRRTIAVPAKRAP